MPPPPPPQRESQARLPQALPAAERTTVVADGRLSPLAAAWQRLVTRFHQRLRRRLSLSPVAPAVCVSAGSRVCLPLAVRRELRAGPDDPGRRGNRPEYQHPAFGDILDLRGNASGRWNRPDGCRGQRERQRRNLALRKVRAPDPDGAGLSVLFERRCTAIRSGTHLF